MNQRTPSTQGVPNVQLEKDDFLTGKIPTPTQVDPTLNQIPLHQTPILPTENNDIPDVHKLEDLPNKNQRAQIAKDIDQQVSPKLQTIEEKIQQDIENAQKQKFANTPQTPKEVLKSLIAKGEYKEDFRLFGQKWTLRGLDQEDLLLSLELVSDLQSTQSGRLVSLMFGTILYSIDAINDVSLYDWFEDIKLADYNNDRKQYHIAVRRALSKYLGAMPPIVIDTLYEKYTELEERRNAGFSELKNS